MILSRAQLLAEVRTLTATQRINQAVIGRLRQIIAAHEASPALAENVRLAHRLEVAELELAQLQSLCHVVDDGRLAAFMAEFPHIFDDREPLL